MTRTLPLSFWVTNGYLGQYICLFCSSEYLQVLVSFLFLWSHCSSFLSFLLQSNKCQAHHTPCCPSASRWHLSSSPCASAARCFVWSPWQGFLIIKSTYPAEPENRKSSTIRQQSHRYTAFSGARQHQAFSPRHKPLGKTAAHRYQREWRWRLRGQVCNRKLGKARREGAESME